MDGASLREQALRDLETMMFGTNLGPPTSQAAMEDREVYESRWSKRQDMDAPHGAPTGGTMDRNEIDPDEHRDRRRNGRINGLLAGGGAVARR